ncbi:MAG: alkaline phosphatase family protein [Elusimicrobiota bacterium]
MHLKGFLAAALAAALCAPASAATRLYWFVPDGLRADPQVFDVFGWAREGKLPNIKKMMDAGSWGYSKPVFPSHTPVNFSALMTGAWPETNGVSDGPMRVEGYPLDKPSVNGFSSTAKKVAPVWKTLENAGLNVTLVSIPGSTPPELDAGTVVRGRGGGWGADFPAINFETDAAERAKRGSGTRLFYLGPELTRYVSARPAEGWSKEFSSRAPALELDLSAYGADVHAYVSGSGDAKEPRYDDVALSFDKKTAFAHLRTSNQWTDWTPATLNWNGRSLDTSVKACLIKLSPDGYVKARLLFDVLNRTIVSPAEAADALEKSVGPMVDFPDNWPAQLNRLPEERDVMLSETAMALDWHRRAAARLLSVEKPDVLIQDTYVPNQMLESRWWMRRVDPGSPDYAATPEAERAARRAEILKMYQGIDAILGEALKNAGSDAIVVLSSDHGILPIKKEVVINNLLAKEGLLVFDLDPISGEPVVDWAKSKVAFLKMIGLYVNPAGLAGPWKRGAGPEYEALRARAASLLAGLQDGGAPVIDKTVPWERAGELHLPKDRVPDLIVAMKPGYALTEDMDKSGDILRASLQSGYKQAVVSDNEPRLWSPFVVMGPGVKKNFRFDAPISSIDQAPTLLKLLGVPSPSFTDGRVVTEILDGAR